MDPASFSREQPLQQGADLTGYPVKPKFKNKPSSNFDLLEWISVLKIPDFRGILSRDEQMSGKHTPCIITLDSYENVGTHWTCCVPSHENEKVLWYFDSFGTSYPEEFKERAKQDGFQVFYNSTQIKTSKAFCADSFVYFSFISGALEKISMMSSRISQQIR